MSPVFWCMGISHEATDLWEIVLWAVLFCCGFGKPLDSSTEICFKKKNLFNETVWVTKQPPLLIIAFLTRGIFGSCWGRDLSRFWMIHPLMEHNQRLPYQNSGAFHADTKPWIQSAGQQNRTEKPVSVNGCSSMNKEIGASTFKISSLQPHCSVKGSWNGGLGSEGRKPFIGRTSSLSVMGWLWT